MSVLGQYTDADFRRTMLNALRLLTILTVVGAALLWVKMGWQSAALLLVGAAISGSGLWEWLRLMTAVMAQMDAQPDTQPEGGASARPMGRVLVNFFVRLGLAGLLLYGSLKFLNGSVYALVAGILLGGFCLMIEGIRLIQAWTL